MSGKQVRAQHTQEFELEAVRRVGAGQAISVVAKVLGIPKASLDNWVRLSARAELDGAAGADKAVKVSPSMAGMLHESGPAVHRQIRCQPNPTVMLVM